MEVVTLVHTAACPTCGGPLPKREVYCRECRVGCCSVVCEAAHFADAHPASAATVSMSGEESTPPDSVAGVVPLAGLMPGTPVRLANGARGVVLCRYPDRGTVRVVYRLGGVELDGLFTPDELAPVTALGAT